MRKFLSILLLALVGSSAAFATILIRRQAAEECESGGSIGTTTRNSSAAYNANRFQYSNFPEDSTGTITHCWARFNNIASGTGFTIGVYDTDGTVKAYYNANSAGTAEAWQGGELNTPVCLADSVYILGVVTADLGWNFFTDTSETGVDRSSIAMTYATTLEDANFVDDVTTHGTNSAYMIQCNDTGIAPS